MARALFDLPMAAKEAVSLKHSRCMRGYEAMGEQTLDEHARPDLKESFYCGLPYPDDHPYVQRGYYSYGANQWPAELPALAPQCAAYTDAMLALARRLMQLMALSLDLPEHWFDGSGDHPMVTLRLLRYPPHPADADERSFGAGAHTDWGAITLLAQDRHRRARRCRCPTAAGATPRRSRARWWSTWATWCRAGPTACTTPTRTACATCTAAAQPRHSIPFFYSPDYLARVEPVPTCVSADNPPRYAPCTAGEHLQQMAAKTYGLRRMKMLLQPAEPRPGRRR